MRQFVIAVIPEDGTRKGADLRTELWYVTNVYTMATGRPLERVPGHVLSLPKYAYVHSHIRNHAKRYRSELVARRVLAKLRPWPGQHLIVQPA